MLRPRCGITIWRMMIAVLVVAINLAAYSVAMKIRGGGDFMGMHIILYTHYDDGSVEAQCDLLSINEGTVWKKYPSLPFKGTVMTKYPTMKGLCRVWWPVAITLGVSALMLRASTRNKIESSRIR